MSKLGRDIAALFKFLERDDYPRNGICSHFGVSIPHPRLNINVSNRGNVTLVTLYSRQLYSDHNGRSYQKIEDHYCIGFPRYVHEARAKAIAAALETEICQEWNGTDGHAGISVVLARRCPASLVTGIANYRRMPRPFNLRDEDRAGFDAFKTWFAGRAALSDEVTR